MASQFIMASDPVQPFVGQNELGQWKLEAGPRSCEHDYVQPGHNGARTSEVFNHTIGNNLLRDYIAHLDPVNTNATSYDVGSEGSLTPFSAASTQVAEDSLDLTVLPTSSKFPLKAPKSFFNHRSQAMSLDMPQQSILKALASRRPSTSNVSIANSLSNTLNATRNSRHSRNPSNVTTKLLASPDPTAQAVTPSTAKFASLQSPCFFHQRFDDAVNIDRVLEEIAAEDDGMSHSRLMQTATSVREISKQLQRRPIKRAVRSIMIVTKARDNSLVYLTRELALWLLQTPRYGSDFGVKVYVDAKLRASKRFDAASILAQNPRFQEMLHYWDPDLCWTSPDKFDLVLTLGGDGTVLFTSFCLFQRVVPPVLAFSLGSLGFLTNFEFASYKESLNSIMGDAGMRVNLRMRFTCTVFRADTGHPRGSKTNPVNTAEMIEGEQFEVLNELVIDRGPSPYVSNLELYGDDELLTVVQADGCIFSTPTGSTAYSLSAGGPLTHPSIPGIILSPICPHTLSFRPMVLSDTLMLKVCIPKNSRSTAYASFDGKHRVELRRGDCVQVEAGRYPFPTVVGPHGAGGEWFDSVRKALRWNTRGAVQKSFHSSKTKMGQEKSTSIPEDEPVMAYSNDDEDDEEEEDEEWDINPSESIEMQSAVDSGVGASEISSP